MKGKGTIEVSASPKVGPQERRPVMFRKKDFEQKLQLARKGLQFQKNRVSAMERQAMGNKKLKPLVTQEKAKLSQMQAQVAQGDKLANFLKTLQGAAVNIRVFYRAGDYQVDLAKTN